MLIVACEYRMCFDNLVTGGSVSRGEKKNPIIHLENYVL